VFFLFIYLYFCSATNSHVCLSFCVSVIDRQEVIADANFSSKSNSESVVEMFSIPPMAQEPQQQHQERFSSLYPTTPTERARRPLKNNLLWLRSHNNNAKRDRHRLYPTAPTERARHPTKAY
jgi:hypothetical protein